VLTDITQQNIFIISEMCPDFFIFYLVGILRFSFQILSEPITPVVRSANHKISVISKEIEAG
jgi:hypothetical protein